MPSDKSLRKIPFVPGKYDRRDLTETFRQLAEMIHGLEGRTGEVFLKDAVHIGSDERHTALRLRGPGRLGTGAIAFSGLDNASMYIAKGAYMDDNGVWVATDATSIIFELARDASTARMYRNTGLAIDGRFQPTAVGWIAVGDSTGHATAPGTTTKLAEALQPMHPLPHTHLDVDLIGLHPDDAFLAKKPHTHLSVDTVDLPAILSEFFLSRKPHVHLSVDIPDLQSALAPVPPATSPHTHLVEDIPNRPMPNDTDWILAGQIFGA